MWLGIWAITIALAIELSIALAIGLSIFATALESKFNVE
jgi:hypothetical protein